MKWVSATIAAAGTPTVSTRSSFSRLANGSLDCFRIARTRMAIECAITTTASQNGKNPLSGPSGPQRKPSRIASARTSPPRSVRKDAVAMSAARIGLLDQPALRHQILVQLLVLLDPLGVLGAGGERRLQRAVLQVLLELRRLVHLLEEAHVPGHRVLRHVRRSEDAAQHLVANVRPERLLHGRDLLPEGIGDAGAVEYRERPHRARLHVLHAFDRVVNGGIDVFAHEVDAHFAAALEGDVGELHAEGLLELDGDDLILLLGAGASHLHPLVSTRALL